MIQIKDVKLKLIGNSYFVLVPMDYIKNGMLDVEKEYDVTLTSAKKEIVDISLETIKDLANTAVMKETKQSNK